MARIPMTEKILNLIWEITCLLSGEDYTVVKKTSHEPLTSSNLPPVPKRGSRIEKPIMEEFLLHSLMHERNNKQKILELTNKINELLTREVPIRCQDVAVCFSMEEWEYLEGHKDFYKNVMMVDNVQAASDLKMDKNKIPLTKLILNLTLDFFAQLTGEQYIIFENDSKTLKSGSHHHISGRRSRKRSSISYPQSQSLIHETNKQKILEHTNKIIELLTEEVPIRCQDVTVYFSMEEWEFVEGHKEMYKDIMMENYQPLSPQKTCPNNATIKKPQITNVRKKPFSCVTCGKSFKYNSRLLRHQIIHTKAKKLYTCTECPKSFISKGDLARHHKVHTGEKPFTCSECGKSFSHEWNLIKHQNNHIQDKPYKCSQCIKCFAIKTALLRHQKIHSEDNPFSCSECGKSFMDKAHLLVHHRVHTGERPYSCVECEKSFAHKHHLTRHLTSYHRVHMGEKLKPHHCSECDKCFITKSELTKHHRVHTGEKPYHCSECDKCFTTKSDLTSHHKVHTGEKPHRCSECDKCFTTKNVLKSHYRIHTGEKPYRCSECDKCFTRKGDLTSHHKIHTGEKPHRCSECDKCFTKKSELTSHHRVHHTGEKPHRCSEYDKCFTTKS